MQIALCDIIYLWLFLKSKTRFCLESSFAQQLFYPNVGTGLAMDKAIPFGTVKICTTFTRKKIKLKYTKSIQII